MIDLKELYENETGKDPWFENELTGTYGLSQDYVEWLEAKFNYTRCCKSDSELLKVLGEHIAEQFDHKAEGVIEQLEWKFKNL